MGEKTKKRPGWLTGDEEDTSRLEPVSEAGAGSTGGSAGSAGGRRGPLAEPAGGEAKGPGGPNGASATTAVPRVGVGGGAPSGAAAGAPSVGARPKAGPGGVGDIVEKVRENPGPIVIAGLAVVVLLFVVYFLFLRGGGEGGQKTQGGESPSGGDAPLAQGAGAAGPVDDTGVIFGRLDESGGKASLQGAGLEWSGTVTKKEGGEGDTVTLEGPTAGQIERGFEIDNSDVESQVYALAQDDGTVLHVATHTYQLVAAQKDEEQKEQVTEEVTLGSIYDLAGGSLKEFGFFIDKREAGSNEVTRSYMGPDGKVLYRVSYEAPWGTQPPLLVGYRGDANEQGGE